MGKVATTPLPPGGSPQLQSGGQNQKWPTSGQGGYITPTAWGSPPLQSGGHNQKWPTSGQGGYITLAAWGVPTVSERGAKSQVAHKWARWLHHPCRFGGPHRCRAGGTIRSGPQMGKVATSRLPPGRSPPLQGGGQNHKWPTSAQGGYITPPPRGVPTASQRGAQPKVAHKWAGWLHHPCRLGGPHRFRAGGPNQNWRTSGKVATSPLPPGGSPALRNGGHNQ